MNARAQAAATHASELAPRSVFSVAEIAPRERFGLWRESISCIFEVEGDRALRRGEFAARVEAQMLGEVMLARTTTLGQAWHRRASTIARDGMDHYMIQLFLTGGMEAEHRGGSASVGARALVVFDLSQEMTSRTGSFSNLSLIVSRETLGAALEAPDEQHMRVLPAGAPLTTLLADHITRLHRLGGSLSSAQAGELGPATIALAAACLNGSGTDSPDRARGAGLARMTLAKRAIEERLTDPELSADAIARTIGVSRTRLYALFEPLGGVTSYLRERRLRRALATLADRRHNHRPIYDVALACGFVNQSAFSRSFARRFGCSPRELRRHGGLPRTPGAAAAAPDRRYELWLQHLSA